MPLEKIKSSFMIILFMISLTLTYNLWMVIPVGETNHTSSEILLDNKNIDVVNILSPQRYVVNFEGDNHTVFFSEPYEIWNVTKPEEKDKIWIWKTAKNELKRYLGYSFELENVNQESWTNINKFKSIRMDFASKIPTKSLIQILSESPRDDLNRFDELEYINSILISSNKLESNTIYLANTDEKIYLRLKGSTIGFNINTLIENIKKTGEVKGYVSYYTNILKQFLEVESDILVPIFNDTSIDSIDVTNEIHASDNVQKRTLADTFFKESFDFIKEITENNGSTIYMYGYGDKSLKISQDGLLEYIEKVNKQKSNDESMFVDSLKIAAAFVDEYIGWPVNAQNAYLSGYETIEKDKKKGYKFYFNYRLNGLPVIVSNIGDVSGLEVEVVDNQVTYYKRIIKRVSQENKIDEKIPNIVNILIKNLEKMKANYVEYNKLDEDTVSRLNIRELITDIQLAYYYMEDTGENNGKLIPVWQVEVDNMVFYLDIYEGQMVYFYKTRGV